MNKNAVILFLKQPLLGLVKTRLAVSIGNEKALSVYKKLLKKTAKTLLNFQHIHSDTDIFLYYTPTISLKDEFNELSPNRRQQSSGNLGDRILTATADIFNTGYQKTVIIGSDCYDLSSTHLTMAFEKLSHSSIVIGPAKDGGYYLIGMNSLYSFLFEDMPWSTSVLCTQTIEKARKFGCTHELLEQLIDIDTIEELNKFPTLKNP